MERITTIIVQLVDIGIWDKCWKLILKLQPRNLNGKPTKTWIANIKGNKATNAPTDEKAAVHEDTKHSKKETKEKEHCIEVPTLPFQYNNDKKSFLAPWVDYWNGPQTQA